MDVRTPPKSEGEQLDKVLEELQREHAVKEISGWDTGFTNLNRALDGLLPGLYLLIGPPGCGKTTFAKQLLDQVAMRNHVPAIFFSFAESQKELRIKTLSRLSEIESREIRRGSSYLLHWYGVPRLDDSDPSQLPASWDKLKRVALEAKTWLDQTYLFECPRNCDLDDIEESIQAVKEVQQAESAFVVIDDSHRLGQPELPLSSRINSIVETLERAARRLNLPIVSVMSTLPVGPDLSQNFWLENVLGASVIGIMKDDDALTHRTPESKRLTKLDIVKNRGGERGELRFDFFAAFSQFAESADS